MPQVQISVRVLFILIETLVVFLSPSTQFAGIVLQIISLPLPSAYFPIHYTLIILPTELLIASFNKYVARRSVGGWKSCPLLPGCFLSTQLAALHFPN
jgi:hypothetical protein